MSTRLNSTVYFKAVSSLKEFIIGMLALSPARIEGRSASIFLVPSQKYLSAPAGSCLGRFSAGTG